ncbi:mitochondrial ribosomal L37p [Fusarium mexicanum]|uniref:Large ribosomal subunit protein mL54 n=1 Tax=Fusarium mexicanum TaxID=751941 RepID=A0A8H5I6K7_9HYPO|nr:mitochondrial ribosomal L37p [Fusarium mexicanum]
MPTPESEQFKAQKPTVPPTFNGVDYDDTKAFKAAEDALIREQWVGAMMTRLVGEELNKCYVREGVNHLENCGHLRERYLQLLKTNKIKGTKFLQQNYVDQKDQELDLAAKVHTSDKIAKLNHGRFSSKLHICTCESQCMHIIVAQHFGGFQLGARLTFYIFHHLSLALHQPVVQKFLQNFEPRHTSSPTNPPPAIVMFCTRCLRATSLRRSQPILRQFSTTTNFRSAEPQLSTPVTAPGEAQKDVPAARSSCAPGTVLNGLNYTKGGQDPVAKNDDEYPEWLWSCLEVLKKSADSADADAGDEFSKSKKQRKLAAKRQKTLEAKLLAEGNLEALAPKIPLQRQSVNILGEENRGVEHNIEAAQKREELRKAMRKERRAKIKETNYLKSM